MATQPDPETKTTIDALIETLKSGGKTDLNTLASELNTDTRVVENWAKILEKGGMVKISYEVGKMFISPLNLTAEQEKVVKSSIQLKAAALQETTSSQLLSLQNLENNLRSMRGAIVEAERVETEEMPQMKKAIGVLNNIYNTVEHNSKIIENLYKNLESEYDSANKKADELSSKIAAINSSASPEAAVPDDIKIKVANLQKNINSLNDELAQASRNSSSSIEQLKKNVIEQTKLIEKEIEQSKKVMNDKVKGYRNEAKSIQNALKEKLRNLSAASQEVENQIKNKEESIRRVKHLKDEFNNVYLKSMEKIKQQNAEAKALSDNLINKINEIKSKFGDALEIDNDLVKTKNDFSDIENEIGETRKELEKMQIELKGIVTMSNLTAEQKDSAIKSLQVKTQKSAAKISGTKKKLDKTSADARNIGKPKKK
jgi:predicted  nucleic acid-binding Zn-ribbon protein